MRVRIRRTERASLVVASLLLFCFVCIATGPKEGKQDLCEKPKCVWINALLRKGELSLGGELSEFEEGKAFCHDGVRLLSLEGISKLWTTLRVSVVATPKDELLIGRGNSSDDALSGDTTATYQRNGTHSLYLSPYNVDCVGLFSESGNPFRYQLTARKTVAYESLVLLGIGLALLFAAPCLSRSVTVFYGAGISIGVLASILILLYVFSKFVPRKTSIVGLGILTGGYTLFASFFYWFWNHALQVALVHWQYIAAYVVVAALISFGVLYRMSPPNNERSLNLIQWTIQLVGVACIYLACPLQEVGVVCVVTAVLLYNLSGWLPVVLAPVTLLFRALGCLLSPFSFLLAPFSCVLSPLCRCLSRLDPRGWFQPKHRLLTQQEYEEQGRVETGKALEDLRKFCRRRDNDEIWDKISNLHDSKRFTSFLAGKAHISAQEQVDYEWNEAGLDSTSESEADEDNVPPHARVNSPHSSGSSNLSYSMNSSSDSPTFTHARRRHTSHLTSTPRTRSPYTHH